MNLFVAILLSVAAFGTVFFVAGLANVPARVRYSVLTVPPSFFLTLLLHLGWRKHLDYGLVCICISTIVSVFFGYQYIKSGPLTGEAKKKMIWRLVVITVLSIISASLVLALIVKMNKETKSQSDSDSITAPTSQTVTVSNSTQADVDGFKRHSHEK